MKVQLSRTVSTVRPRCSAFDQPVQVFHRPEFKKDRAHGGSGDADCEQQDGWSGPSQPLLARWRTVWGSALAMRLVEDAK